MWAGPPPPTRVKRSREAGTYKNRQFVSGTWERAVGLIESRAEDYRDKRSVSCCDG